MNNKDSETYFYCGPTTLLLFAVITDLAPPPPFLNRVRGTPYSVTDSLTNLGCR